MTATLTQPVQTQTRTGTKLANGGLPPRTYNRADSGGGGGGGQMPNWEEFSNFPSVTEPVYNIENERGMQKLRGGKLKVLEEKIRALQEQYKTEQSRTQLATAQNQLVQVSIQVVEGKTQVASLNAQTEGQKALSAAARLGMEEDNTAFLNAQRTGVGMLKMQALQSINLQLSEASGRNENKQEWLQLSGWNGGALPAAQNGFATAGRFGGGALRSGIPNPPTLGGGSSLFNSSAFRLRPIHGLGRRW